MTDCRNTKQVATCDHPAFILGNGPTLPVDDLDVLGDQFTVGVNRILRSGFCPTVILWVDGSVGEEDGDAIGASGALSVCDASVYQRQGQIGLKTHVGSGALKHEATATELCCNGSTGCCAARWAIALGCRPVYLVGMSCQYIGGVSDFYGNNPHHHRTPEDNGTLMLMRNEMARLRLDHGDIIRHVPTGGLLREIAAELQPQDQGEIRSRIVTKIGSNRVT